MPQVEAGQFPWGTPVAILLKALRPLVFIRDEDAETLFARPYREVEGRWPGHILTRHEAAAVLRQDYPAAVVTTLLGEIDAALGLISAHERAARLAQTQEDRPA